MERRLILAMVLSLFVVLGWSALVSKLHLIDNKRVTVQAPVLELHPSSPSIAVSPANTTLALNSLQPTPVLWKFSQGQREYVFRENQGAIQEVVFKEYQSYKFPLGYGFLMGDKNLEFRRQTPLPQEVAFVYNDPEKQITKRFLIHNTNDSIELEITIQNLGEEALNFSFPLLLGVLDTNTQGAQGRFQDITVANADKVSHLTPRKTMTFPEVKYISLRDRYGCSIIEPASAGYQAFTNKIDNVQTEFGLISPNFSIAPGQEVQQKFLIYLGPQDLKLIKQIKPEWSEVMYFGMFTLISYILANILDFLYAMVHNWGLAIIILSVLIYVILYPLTLKQLRSMKQMQALQPHIAEIRSKYKDNPQRLNKELLMIYKEHRVNPFGGCLPLILQLPIFVALYQFLSRAIALKGAAFLWIKDLSEPDRLFVLKQALPFLGNDINILPILMAICMFFQQKTSSQATSPETAQQQKMMLILFPIMFGFIFYRMPAGLVLYWFTNSILMFVNQWRVSRVK